MSHTASLSSSSSVAAPTATHIASSFPTSCLDDKFGPWAGPVCRGGFDFTLLFEETILTIPIQALFLYVLPIRILTLLREDKKVRSSWHRIAKIVCSVLFLIFNIAALGLWNKVKKSDPLHTPASVPTAALTVGASVGICVLSYLEHGRTLRPSFLISVYLVLSLICGLARIRTLWMIENPSVNAIPAIQLVAYLASLVMLVVESIEKRGILLRDSNFSPEMLAGTINRAFFLWLMPLFRLGHKRNFILDDLYLVDEKMRAEAVHDTLTRAWAREPNKTKPGIFMWTWVKAFAGPLLAPVIPRLFVTAFTFTQPYLIQQAVTLAALPEKQPFDNWGYGLIGAFFLTYGGLAVASGQYAWFVRRFGARIRGSLNAMIFEKSLKLDITAPGVAPIAGITLIGNDAETIVQGLLQFHDIWASIVEIAIAIFLVERKLGAACAVPVALGIISIVATLAIAAPTGKAQAKWIAASQDRVGQTSKTLGAVKGLKVSGLTEMAFSMVRKLRTRELAISMRYRLLFGTSMMLMVLVPIWSPILTFATWAGVSKSHSGNGLGLGTVFASYSLITVMNGPLGTLINALPTVAGALASFQRVQDHLNGNERDDNRANGPDMSSRPKSFLPRLSDDSFSNTVYGSESFEMYEVARHSMLPKASLSSEIIASVDGQFSWTGSGEAPVLDIHGLEIRRGHLTFVLGPVGCGKSTLLKTFLGELGGFDGRIRTDFKSLSYCDQSPWVPNTSVRNIIIGPMEFDERWYQTVLEACALEEDIYQWPRGDRTVAGSGGLALSGGQKQRLSLARAVYARREFVLLDDVFAGLDSATENWVFHSLMGRNGLLRDAGVTVLCASSQINRLRYADHLVFLDEKGQLKDMGSPKELEHALGESSAVPKWDIELKPHDLPPPEVTGKEEEEVLDPVEEAQLDQSRRLGDSSMYMFYARAAGRTTLLALLVSMGVYAFCMAYPTVWLGKWQSSKNPLDHLSKWLGVYVALGIGAVLAIGSGTWQIVVRMIDRAGKYFHDNMVDVVAKAPMSFYSTVDNGITLNRFSQDIRLIDFELPGASFGVATAIASVIAQFIMVSIASKYMAAFLPVLVVGIYFIQGFYLRTSRQMRLLDIENKSPLYTQLVEMLRGLPTIRAYGWEDWVTEKNYVLVDNSQRPAYLLACCQCWLNMVTDLIVMVIALVFITLTTTLRSQIGAQQMGVGLSNILGFSNTVKTFVTFWVVLEIALGAVSRVRSFTEDTDYEGSGDEPPKSPPDGITWPTSGEIRLDNIFASYPTSGPVLKGINLTIHPGEKVAICGRTGSGKSSLTLCLLRLMELDEGHIFIDGEDTKTLPHDYLREKMVALPQSAYVFDGTVRLNLDPTKELPDHQIIEVLQRVELWGKIESRGGLDTIIGDTFFSPGEAQLLVFARAMLRQSRILILDEFTSSLDEKTSGIVEKLLREWFEGWTIITIAHKLDAILDFDKIAMMESGNLVEYDSPKSLLETDSHFRSLYDQFASQ